MKDIKNRKGLFDEINKERDRQDFKHPYPKGFPNDIRMEILAEEVGEVAKAKLEGDQSQLRDELIQVAATAVRWIECLDLEKKNDIEKLT